MKALHNQPAAMRRLPRNVWALTAVSFLTDISSEMLFNLLPLFLANVLGVRTATIGLIEGIAQSTASLLKIVSGWFSDRVGQRKWLTVSGYALSAVVKPFLLLAVTWPGILGVRFADRIGKGIRNAPRDALVADSVEEPVRGLAFGIQRAGDTAGAMLGLVLALLVVWHTQAGRLSLERLTFQRIVLLSILPAALAVVILAAFVRDVMPVKRAEEPSLTIKGLDSRLKRFLLVLALFTLGNSADAFLILRAQERGIAVTGLLGVLVLFNFVYASLSGPLGSLSDRIGRRRLITARWLAYGLIYLGFAFAGQVWQIWLLYALYGVYYASVEGVARAYVADLAMPEQRGTAFGLYNGITGAMALPASLLAGVLWQGIGSWAGFGPSAPFFLGSLLALASAVLFTVWH